MTEFNFTKGDDCNPIITIHAKFDSLDLKVKRRILKELQDFIDKENKDCEVTYTGDGDFMKNI